MFFPTQVRVNSFLRNCAGQGLNCSARMLLLPRIDDRVRTNAVQDPVHPAELFGGNCDGDFPAGNGHNQLKIVPLAIVIVQNDVADNSSVEVSDSDDLETSGTVTANHLGRFNAVSWQRTLSESSLLSRKMVSAFFLRTHPYHSESHNRGRRLTYECLRYSTAV